MFGKRIFFAIAIVMLILSLGIGTTAADDRTKPAFKPAEKAYLTAAQLAFIRPGLHLQIQKVEFSPPKVNVTFRISDDQDQGLERLGIDTPGPINIGYTLARIKPGNQQYTSCRVGGGALARWPPSAAQTARTVFPYAAFTMRRCYEMQATVLTE